MIIPSHLPYSYLTMPAIACYNKFAVFKAKSCADSRDICEMVGNVCRKKEVGCNIMKKAFLSPLCSALVIPGLGQILNREIKKGVFILLGVLLLLVLGVVRLYQMINAVLQNLPINRLDPENVMAGLKAQDYSFLWILMFVFVCLWLYSVLDAYITGQKMDQQ